MLAHQLVGLREAAHDTWQRFQLRGADHFCDLTNQAGGSASQALVFLLTRITVGESSFFRIAEHMAFLRNTWLPTIIERRRAEGKLTLRIWSAGCSVGEEIYTMALLLHEAIPDISRWRLTLLGTDINEDAVARAGRPLSSVVAARHG